MSADRGDALCDSVYVGGHRRGRPCPYRATSLVDPTRYPPFRVCGYHARGYAPRIVYPLAWSLARIRQWQMDNLNALLTEPKL